MPTPAVHQSAAELLAQGNPEQALAMLSSALAESKHIPGFWLQLAEAQLACKRPRDALFSLASAQKLTPDDPDIYFAAGVVLTALERFDEAANAYRLCLAHVPNHAGALRNLPSLLFALNQLDAALSIANRACLAYPEQAWSHYNHADLLLGFVRYTEAEAAFRQALHLAPHMAQVAMGLAITLAAQGDIEAAAPLHTQALTLDPEIQQTYRSPLRIDRGNQVPTGPDIGRIAALAIYERLLHFEWDRYQTDLALFERLIAGTPATTPLKHMELAYLGLLMPLPPPLKQQLCRQISAEFLAQAPRVNLRRSPISDSARIRIGYLSSDFRLHPVGSFFGHVFGLHDRRYFEVFAYSTGPNDQSPQRKRVEAESDVFRDMQHKPPVAIAQTIAQDNIDILIDLAGYSLHAQPSTLLFRPAPLQALLFGFMGTLGAPYVDYVFLDHIVMQANERPFWDEHVVYMPDTLSPCPPPNDTLWGAASAAPQNNDQIILGALHSPRKVSQKCLALWFEVLDKTPNSILFLIADNARQEAALTSEAHRHGLQERIRIFPGLDRNEYSQLLAQVHLMLDIPDYSGHTTTLEALKQGVPVITLKGGGVIGNVGASLLTAHGLGELVTENKGDFVRLVQRFSTDPEWREALREKTCAHANSRLFDAKRWVRYLETAYQIMWERHRASLPPIDFDVPPIIEA